MHNLQSRLIEAQNISWDKTVVQSITTYYSATANFKYFKSVLHGKITYPWIYSFLKYCLSVQEEVMDEVEDEEEGPVWEAAPATSKAPAVCSVACECQSRSTVVFERALVFERTFTSTIAGECVSLFFPQWCLELGERGSCRCIRGGF